MTVSPSTGLTSGQSVQATVTGSGAAVEGPLYLAQCDAAVDDAGPPTLAELFDSCGDGAAVLPGTRPTQQAYRVTSTFTSFTGRVISCGGAPQDCLVTVTGESGQPYAAAPIDIEAGALRIHATPTANLVAGTPIAVTVTGTRTAEVGVAQCAAPVADTGDVFTGPCGPPTLVPAGSEAAELTLEADDVLDAADGTTVTCGGNCVVAAATRSGDQLAVTPIEFAGDEAEVHAVPATGLVDGQSVLVVATDVLPSVDGPPIFGMPTGRWSVLQCGRAIADDPTIAGLFAHCATPPGGGPVTGDGSDLVVDIDVLATLAPPAGPTADCSTAAGACVVALARIEADASVSLLTGPLTFGS